MPASISIHSVVADQSIHPLIQAGFGDLIPLIDAEEWLGGIQRLKTPGHAQVSDLLLHDVLGVAAMSGTGLAEQLASQAAEFHLPFRSFDSPGEEELAKWIVGIALAGTRAAWADAAEARLAAAVLRQDLDSQQQAFQALEEAARDFGMPQFTLALDLPMATGGVTLTGGDCAIQVPHEHAMASGRLTQRLPVSARGIASVDLHCERMMDFPQEGRLTVSVFDLAGNQLASSETIETSDLAQGWNRFNLPEGIDCPDRDAVVELSLDGAGAIRFALGPCVPIDRFHPKRADSTSICDAPLAMKIWRGFAKVRTPRPHVRISEGGLIRWRPGDLPMASLLSTDDPEMGFEPVQYWAKEDAFLIHPPAKGMTVGIIRDLDLENVVSVSAIVNNNHREGPPLSFAVGVAQSGSFFHAPDVLGSWLKLPPLGWGEIHAPLPEPVSGKFDLVIATMVAEGLGNRMAWGLFRGFMTNTHTA